MYGRAASSTSSIPLVTSVRFSDRFAVRCVRCRSLVVLACLLTFFVA